MGPEGSRVSAVSGKVVRGDLSDEAASCKKDQLDKEVNLRCLGGS